VIRRT